MSGLRARMADGAARAAAAGKHAVDWARARRARIEPAALAVALALFFGGLSLSLAARPDALSGIDPRPLLLVALVTVPAGLLLGVVDFRLMARLAGLRVGFAAAFGTVLYARAANLLPIPGSLAVRMAALKGGGATLARAGGLSLLFTAVWAGTGFCLSALFLALHAPWLAAAFGGAGLALLGGAAAAGRRRDVSVRAFLAVVAVRSGFVVTEAVALLLGLRALGVEVGLDQSAILVVASSISSLFPAGIGVREALVALLAPLAGVPAATGFLAAAALRLVGLAVLGLSAGGMLVHVRCRSRREGIADG